MLTTCIRVLNALMCACVAQAWADLFEVSDYQQTPVTLKQPATRIIALAPHIVENLFAIGAGDTVVGTVEHADYPEAAQAIPRVGNINGLSVEVIISLQPDLVIAWLYGISPQLQRQLQEFGIPVYLDDPRKLEDVATSIQDFSVLTGKQQVGLNISKAYLASLQKLRHEFSNRSPVSVMYQVWSAPLQTLNGEHMISDMIRLCGGRNVFGDADVIAPKISIESVLLRDPDAIVAPKNDVASARDALTSGSLDQWQQWPELAAVRQNNLIGIEADMLQRHTLRLVEGAEHLCLALDAVRKKIKK